MEERDIERAIEIYQVLLHQLWYQKILKNNMTDIKVIINEKLMADVTIM
jgi:hypothetical protein